MGHPPAYSGFLACLCSPPPRFVFPRLLFTTSTWFHFISPAFFCPIATLSLSPLDPPILALDPAAHQAKNIRAIHLRGDETIALPIFQRLPEGKRSQAAAVPATNGEGKAAKRAKTDGAALTPKAKPASTDDAAPKSAKKAKLAAESSVTPSKGKKGARLAEPDVPVSAGKKAKAATEAEPTTPASGKKAKAGSAGVGAVVVTGSSASAKKKAATATTPKNKKLTAVMSKGKAASTTASPAGKSKGAKAAKRKSIA